MPSLPSAPPLPVECVGLFVALAAIMRASKGKRDIDHIYCGVEPFKNNFYLSRVRSTLTSNHSCLACIQQSVVHVFPHSQHNRRLTLMFAGCPPGGGAFGSAVYGGGACIDEQPRRGNKHSSATTNHWSPRDKEQFPATKSSRRPLHTSTAGRHILCI